MTSLLQDIKQEKHEVDRRHFLNPQILLFSFHTTNNFFSLRRLTAGRIRKRSTFGAKFFPRCEKTIKNKPITASWDEKFEK